ncbi:MAG: hypothetical protein AAGF58_06570 [Pseudomonadota bacterium]
MSAVSKEVHRLAAAIGRLEKAVVAQTSQTVEAQEDQRRAIYAEISRNAKPVEERVDAAIEQLEMLLGEQASR